MTNLLRWATVGGSQVEEPPDAKKTRGWNAGEPGAAEYINQWMQRVGDITGVDIIVGSSSQVTAKRATHTVSDFVAAIANGDTIFFLSGAHTLVRNEDITETGVIIVGEGAEAILVFSTFTFTVSGSRAVITLRTSGAGAGDIILSGADGKWYGYDTPFSAFNVTAGNWVVNTNGEHQDIDAANITRGILDDARIPNLSANKITTDVLNQARVPFEAPGPIGGTTPNSIVATSIEAGDAGDRTAFKVKIIDIGNWNMDTTPTFDVAHGLDWTKIRSVFILIRNDLETLNYDLAGASTRNGWFVVDPTNIDCRRNGGELFNSTSFDVIPGNNRGWITIVYI